MVYTLGIAAAVVITKGGGDVAGTTGEVLVVVGDGGSCVTDGKESAVGRSER
jgi:hypothetical protein